MEQKRIVFVDYIRVIACFLVMLVHASECFYAGVSSDTVPNAAMLATEGNRLWVSIYDGVLGRISVPLFMVVSAFLLVPMKKGVTMGGFYKHRLLRILPPTILFMVLYCFLPVALWHVPMEQAWHEFTLLPFNFPSVAGHLWFMYPLISLYLIIPVVSPWLKQASAKDERLFLYIFALSTLAPWLTRFVSADLWGTCFWNPHFGMLYYCSGYLGYLVLAHYIRFHLDWSRAKRMKIGAVCFLIGGLFTGWSFWETGVPGKVMETPMLEWSWEFCTPNVLCASFGAFLLFTCIEKKQAPRMITDISRLSFGMYLMHIFFLYSLAPIVIGGDVAHPLIPVWIAIPLMAVITYICAYITSKLLSYLPGSKWIVGA